MRHTQLEHGEQGEKHPEDLLLLLPHTQMTLLWRYNAQLCVLSARRRIQKEKKLCTKIKICLLPEGKILLQQTNHSDSEIAKLTVLKTSTPSLSTEKALSKKLVVKTIVL